MSCSQQAIVAGWREWVELSDVGIPRLEAKIDTGTDVSILYTSFIEHYRRDNELWVRFCVNTPKGEACSRFVCQAPVKCTEIHEASDTHNESFFVIEDTIKVGVLQTQQEIVLKNEAGNKYMMRLGRKALEDMNLQVDPTCSYLHGDYSDYKYRQLQSA